VNEVVCAGLDRPNSVLDVVRRDHHDGQQPRSWLGTQPPAHLEPIHAWHHDVQEDEVGPLALDLL